MESERITKIWILGKFPEHEIKIQIALTSTLLLESSVLLSYFENKSSILILNLIQEERTSIRGFLKNMEYCLHLSTNNNNFQQSTIKNGIEFIASLGIFGPHYIDECIKIARLLDLRIFLRLLQTAKSTL